MLQLLQYLDGNGQLEGKPAERGGSDGALPNSGSVASLLGLLRSNSLQQSLAELAQSPSNADLAGQSGSQSRNRSLADLQSLQTLARAASSEAFDTSANGTGCTGHASRLQLMPPPPQQQPQHAHGRAAHARGMLTSAMLGDGQATLKESGSVSSLVDMVRSSSASSLVEFFNSCSSNNLAAMGRDESNGNSEWS